MENYEGFDPEKFKESFKIEVKYKNISTNVGPAYQYEGDSGFDLRANITGDVTLHQLDRVLIPTGLYFELPDGYELQIRPRSGLANKHGVTVLNTPATIDQKYVGEVQVLLINLSKSAFVIKNGDRIAQGVVCPRLSTEFGKLVEVSHIGNTDRGSSGFGSTGIK